MPGGIAPVSRLDRAELNQRKPHKNTREKISTHFMKECERAEKTYKEESLGGPNVGGMAPSNKLSEIKL
jgi:hypothetical protein